MAEDTPRSLKPGAPDLSPVDARQGRTGTPVLLVLVGGLVLAAMVWAGVEMWGEHIDPDKSQTAAPGPGPSSNLATGATQKTLDASPRQGEPAQMAPVDRSENNQRGIDSTPQQPTRNGIQK